MTIVTKPISERKNDKPLVINENPGAEGNDHTVIDPTSDDVEAWLSSTARRRVSTATTICVFITALLVMSIGIIGGVYLYRQIAPMPMNRFRGFCGIPYDKDLMGRKRVPPFSGKPISSSLYKEGFRPIGPYGRVGTEVTEDAEWTPGALFKEEFELDLQDNSYEEIHVPNFEFGRPGRFVHDFKVNKTGIIDYTSGRCFVMDLDRRLVMPPRTVYDMIKKMWSGYYNVDTRVVERTMRVQQPPVSDYEPLGIFISKKCGNIPTYMLTSIQSDVKKRSVDAQLKAGENDDLQFVEFAGKNIVQLTILDDDAGLQQQ